MARTETVAFHLREAKKKEVRATVRYVRLSLAIKALEAKIDAIKATREPFAAETLAEALTHKGAETPLKVLGHSVLYCDGAVRLDGKEAEKLLEGAGIDVPRKKGAAYVQVR